MKAMNTALLILCSRVAIINYNKLWLKNLKIALKQAIWMMAVD